MSAWTSGNLAAKLKQQKEKPGAAAPDKKEPAAVKKSPTLTAAKSPSLKAKSSKSTPKSTPKAAAPVPSKAPLAELPPSVAYGPVSIPESLVKYLSDEFTFVGRVAPVAPADTAAAPVAAAPVAAPPAAPAPAEKQSYARTVQSNPPQPVAAVGAPVAEQPVPVDQYYQSQPPWQQYQSNPNANFFVPQQRQQYNINNNNRTNNNYGDFCGNNYRYAGQAFGEIPRQYAMRQQHQQHQQHQPYYPSYEYGNQGAYSQRYADPYMYNGGNSGMCYNNNYGYNGNRLQPLPPYYPPHNSNINQRQQPMPPQGY